MIITIFGLRRVSCNVDRQKIYPIQGTFLAFLHDQVTVQQETSDGKHEDLISR